MANDNFLNDPFGSDMNNIFNNMMGNMNGYNSENRRYLIQWTRVTPEQFAQYRQSGQLPQGQQAIINGDSTGRQAAQSQGQPQPEGILAKLGRNLTQEAL